MPPSITPAPSGGKARRWACFPHRRWIDQLTGDVLALIRWLVGLLLSLVALLQALDYLSGWMPAPAR